MLVCRWPLRRKAFEEILVPNLPRSVLGTFGRNAQKSVRRLARFITGMEEKRAAPSDRPFVFCL